MPDPMAPASKDETSWQCTAKAKTTGERCRRPVVKGATVCRHHGGAARQVRAVAKRRLALGAAEEELVRLGVPIEVDPAEAMLQMVYEAAGNVATARNWLASSPADPREWRETDRFVKQMYDEEREKVVRWGKYCRDAGVEEHRVKLAERQGEMLAQVLRVLLASLMAALTAAGAPEAVVRTVWQSEVPGIVRKALGEAGGEAA